MTGHRAGTHARRPIVIGGLAGAAALALVLWLAGFGNQATNSAAQQNATTSTGTPQAPPNPASATATTSPTPTASPRTTQTGTPSATSSPSPSTTPTKTPRPPGTTTATSTTTTTTTTGTVTRPANGHLVTIVNADYAFDDSATMSCKGDCDYRIVFGVTPGAG